MAKDSYKKSVKTETTVEKPKKTAETEATVKKAEADVEACKGKGILIKDVNLLAQSIALAIANSSQVTFVDESARESKEPEPSTKTAFKPASEEELKPESKPTEKPKVVVSKPKTAEEPKPTEKPKAEAKPVVVMPSSANAGRNGPAKAYKYWDYSSRQWLFTSNIFVADQLSNGEWMPVWVWYTDGVIDHILTSEEVKKYCP